MGVTERIGYTVKMVMIESMASKITRKTTPMAMTTSMAEQAMTACTAVMEMTRFGERTATIHSPGPMVVTRWMVVPAMIALMPARVTR